jgi:general secretion pathway protein G
MVTKRKSGFTLVEILIVVVILGILAAIVIPQFSNASSEARESSLTSNLQAVRSQIELFKIQHLQDELPGDDAGTAAEFLADLEGETELDGTVGDDSGDEMGPYMRAVPENPCSSVNADPDGDGTRANLVRYDGAAAGANTHHWRFDSTTGAFQADDDGSNADGVAHSDL